MNRATTIGHQGNDIAGFLKALLAASSMHRTKLSGCRIEAVEGKIEGLKQITVTHES